MNRTVFQNENFNVEEALMEIDDIKDYETHLNDVLDQIQKDIVTVLDTNYTTLIDLQSRIKGGLKLSEKIEEEVSAVEKMTKSTLLISDVDVDSPEGRLIKLREQKQMLITEHYLKQDLEYLRKHKIVKSVDLLDTKNLELLEYYLLIASRAKSFIQQLSEERQQTFIKQYEPIRHSIDIDCVFLLDILKQFKIQMAANVNFSSCMATVCSNLKLSGKWEESIKIMADKIILESMNDLNKTLQASVTNSKFELKYTIIENYLQGFPLMFSKLIHPYASTHEKITLILDSIFQNVVKFITDAKFIATSSSEYPVDFQKSILFVQYFKSNFVDPFQLEHHFKSHPGFIILKRKFNPVPYATLQKVEISKSLTIPFDSKKTLKRSKCHFEYFDSLFNILTKVQGLQLMSQTLEVTCHIQFSIFDSILENSKLFNELSNAEVEFVFLDLLKNLSFFKEITNGTNIPDHQVTYNQLINARFDTLSPLLIKLANFSVSAFTDGKLQILQQMRNIPSVVRMGSKPVGQEPSSFVLTANKEIEGIIEHFALLNVQLLSVYPKSTVLSKFKIKESVIAYIIAIANDVLATIKKTEESLKRFKKATSTATLSDEDKMRAQIYTDACNLFSNLQDKPCNFEFEVTTANITIKNAYIKLDSTKEFLDELEGYFK